MAQRKTFKLKVVFRPIGHVYRHNDWGIAVRGEEYLFFHKYYSNAEDDPYKAMRYRNEDWERLLSPYLKGVYKGMSFEEACMVHISENPNDEVLCVDD